LRSSLAAFHGRCWMCRSFPPSSPHARLRGDANDTRENATLTISVFSGLAHTSREKRYLQDGPKAKVCSNGARIRKQVARATSAITFDGSGSRKAARRISRDDLAMGKWRQKHPARSRA